MPGTVANDSDPRFVRLKVEFRNDLGQNTVCEERRCDKDRDGVLSDFYTAAGVVVIGFVMRDGGVKKLPLCLMIEIAA